MSSQNDNGTGEMKRRYLDRITLCTSEYSRKGLNVGYSRIVLVLPLSAWVV